MYGQVPKRWGDENEDLDSLDLIAKKDQQIRKLQAELQQERRRSQNALKLLESRKSINSQTEQASQGLRSQISRRIKAQQEVKRLKIKNQQLQNGIRQLIRNLQQKLDEKIEKQLISQQYSSED